MRGRAVLTAAGLAAALVTTTGPADAMTTGPTSAEISKTEAQRLAKAGVLTKADLPGYEVTRSTRDATDEDFEKRLYTCLGVKAPQYLARNPGRSFTLGNLSIDSSAAVAATVEQARTDFGAVGSKKGAACYRKLFQEYFAEQGAEVQELAVKKIPVAVESADQAFAFRVAGTFTIEGNPVLLEALLVAARVGQTEFLVSPGRFGGGTPSLKQARALTNKVAKRVAAV